MTYLKNKRMEYRKLHSKETTGHKLENRVYEKYGYRHKDGVMELVIDEEAAENIRMIYDLICEGTEITRQMEEYILRGGVYGTNTNRVAVQQQKKGGKVRYALSKIFIPYDVIKFHYPILQKHKWLTPIMEVRRWGKLIFCGHLKRTVNELKYNSTISDDAAAEAKTLLKNVGL